MRINTTAPSSRRPSLSRARIDTHSVAQREAILEEFVVPVPFGERFGAERRRFGGAHDDA